MSLHSGLIGDEFFACPGRKQGVCAKIICYFVPCHYDHRIIQRQIRCAFHGFGAFPRGSVPSSVIVFFMSLQAMDLIHERFGG